MGCTLSSDFYSLLVTCLAAVHGDDRGAPGDAELASKETILPAVVGPLVGQRSKSHQRTSDFGCKRVQHCSMHGWLGRMTSYGVQQLQKQELGWRTVDCKVSDVGVGLMGQSSRLCLAQQQTIQFSTLLVSLMAVLPNKATTTTHTGLHS